MSAIVTWLWHGERDYRPEHVALLGDMIRRFCEDQYRLVCFSEMEGDHGAFEVFPLPEATEVLQDLRTPEAGHFPTCYRRLWLFSEDAASFFSSGKVLLTDVDALVIGDLAPLFEYDEDFIGWRPPLAWGTEDRFAGGMWLHRTGTRLDVWEDFIAEPETAIGQAKAAGFRGSDQAWLSYKLTPDCPCWPLGAGVHSIREWNKRRRGGVRNPVDLSSAICVHFNGILKPWDEACQEKHPWVTEYLA